MAKKGLRFAPLIRVSTESQSKKGESLNTQKTRIENTVAALGGVIPEFCWKYTGNEHATPGFEREKFNQLLSDCEKDLFDAIIVDDLSRWSRDNAANKAGLEILKKHKIRLFAAGQEINLFSPDGLLQAGILTEFNEYFARQQAYKSLLNRIQRAKKGCPSGGKPPYGRTFNRETNQWGIDEEKANKIRWAAEYYLSGGSVVDASKKLGMNNANLWKLLTKRSGEDWGIRFKKKEFDIDITIPIKVPPLLSQETIDAIHQKAKENKTFTHGNLKHKYLLARAVLCANCGYAMFGQTNRNGKRYYRHARKRVKKCDMSFWVPADKIEDAVIKHLFSMFGDATGMERAMQKAIPNPEKVKALETRQAQIHKALEETETERKRIVNAIAKGILTPEDAREKMDALRERQALLREEAETIRPQLESVPDAATIKRKAARMKRLITSIYNRKARLEKMSWADKRKLVELAFSGKPVDGKRCGVYVQKPAHRGDPVEFTIKGQFSEKKGQAPFDDERYIEPELLDNERTDDKELNIHTKCHAHNGIRIHQ